MKNSCSTRSYSGPRNTTDFGQLNYRVRWMQYRDPVHLLRLLRPCTKRQQSDSTDDSNELTPSHSITSHRIMVPWNRITRLKISHSGAAFEQADLFESGRDAKRRIAREL